MKQKEQANKPPAKELPQKSGKDGKLDNEPAMKGPSTISTQRIGGTSAVAGLSTLNLGQVTAGNYEEGLMIAEQMAHHLVFKMEEYMFIQRTLKKMKPFTIQNVLSVVTARIEKFQFSHESKSGDSFNYEEECGEPLPAIADSLLCAADAYLFGN